MQPFRRWTSARQVHVAGLATPDLQTRVGPKSYVNSLEYGACMRETAQRIGVDANLKAQLRIDRYKVYRWVFLTVLDTALWWLFDEFNAESMINVEEPLKSHVVQHCINSDLASWLVSSRSFGCLLVRVSLTKHVSSQIASKSMEAFVQVISSCGNTTMLTLRLHAMESTRSKALSIHLVRRRPMICQRNGNPGTTALLHGQINLMNASLDLDGIWKEEKKGELVRNGPNFRTNFPIYYRRLIRGWVKDNDANHGRASDGWSHCLYEQKYRPQARNQRKTDFLFFKSSK